MNNTHTIITKGFATAAGEGERIWFVADTLTLKATAESTGKSYTVVECLTAPGGGPPPHVHTREDEFWYVLDGTFEIHIGDKVHAVGPGGFAFGPRGTPHHFRNTAATPSRILLGFTPGGIEDFFRESVSLQLTTVPRPRSMRPKSPAWRRRRRSTASSASRPTTSCELSGGCPFGPD